MKLQGIIRPEDLIKKVEDMIQKLENEVQKLITKTLTRQKEQKEKSTKETS